MCDRSSVTFDLRQCVSPRVRGNPSVGRRRTHRSRSIPACAGEPRHSCSMPLARGVYPRVCGEPRRGGSILAGLRGLSPRVRGNPDCLFLHGHWHGSIPACAGEPPARPPLRLYLEVYPRVCGGTEPFPATFYLWDGLSPRVRGNLHSMFAKLSTTGSIPACAGEPVAIPNADGTVTVYPRVCGGTRFGPKNHCRNPGLSPRVRGNRIPGAHQAAL